MTYNVQNNWVLLAKKDIWYWSSLLINLVKKQLKVFEMKMLKGKNLREVIQ